jgi:hypothetical protein
MRKPNKPQPTWFLFFFFLLQLAVGFLVIDGKTLSFDESIWHYIGRNWFRYGFIPYSGGVDNKSPFMFAIFGFSDLFFGTNFWFPRLMGAIAQSIGILFLYKLVLKIAGNRAAIIAISIYGLTLAWKSTGGKYISYTESYEICLMIVAFYYFHRDEQKKSFFISGFLAGLSIFFRITGAFGALALFIASLRKGRIRSLLFVSGLSTAFILTLSTFAIAGISLNDVFFYSIADNFGKGSVSSQPLLWKLETLTNAFFLSDLTLFIPGVVGYVLIKKRVDVFGLWLVFVFIGINIIGLYARQHFRDLLPPMCVMTALSGYYVMEKLNLNLKAILVVTWISFFPKHIEPPLALKNILKPGRVQERPFCEDASLKVFDEDKRKLGEWIENSSVISEKVYIGGMSAVVQVYANRISPAIYFNATQTAHAIQKTKDDLGQNKPAFILVPQSDEYLRVDPSIRKLINEMVMREYRYEGCKYNYAVYRLIPQ